MTPAEALHAGRTVILPTDTVYGLCSLPDEAAVEELYRVKGRRARQPTALVAASLDALLAAVPELPPEVPRALLPGPYTLILPNPARRFPWLTGETPEKIGVRIPNLPPQTQAVLREVGAIVATSANTPGGPDPRRLEDVPPELRSRVAAAVDGGELPGRPSTVLDLTGPEPRVLREGAVPAEEALAAVSAARR
ncbi:MAG: threonylcarbamoyl-AMP synthase [Actinobacteria bacterium]|nr:threonylcarbamoyl-AMP synthase [Actinomycetota bacterium]MBV8563230.1 threonylcarbamoyl-AMP synthase [Actinomycetota bacterium]